MPDGHHHAMPTPIDDRLVTLWVDLDDGGRTAPARVILGVRLAPEVYSSAVDELGQVLRLVLLNSCVGCSGDAVLHDALQDGLLGQESKP